MKVFDCFVHQISAEDVEKISENEVVVCKVNILSPCGYAVIVKNTLGGISSNFIRLGIFWSQELAEMFGKEYEKRKLHHE